MILVQRGNENPISSFQVFGERCSGTNYLEALIASNFPTLKHPCIQTHNEICVQWRYGWKHGFPHAPILPPNVLFLVIFRHPETWLSSLHRTPWHVAPRLASQPFSRFIREPWQCVANNPGFGGHWGTPEYAMELNLERHPLTGERFPNALKLRNAKNVGFMSLAKRTANCVFVQYEEVRNGPADFIGKVGSAFGLQAAATFKAVDTAKGRSGQYQSGPILELSQSDRAFIWNELDGEIEDRLGYDPLA